MNDQKSEKEPYIISQEEYKSKIQPSWDKKTPLILAGAKWMDEH